GHRRDHGGAPRRQRAALDLSRARSATGAALESPPGAVRDPLDGPGRRRLAARVLRTRRVRHDSLYRRARAHPRRSRPGRNRRRARSPRRLYRDLVARASLALQRIRPQHRPRSALRQERAERAHARRLARGQAALPRLARRVSLAQQRPRAAPVDADRAADPAVGQLLRAGLARARPAFLRRSRQIRSGGLAQGSGGVRSAEEFSAGMDSLNDPAPKTHRGRWLLPLALFIATLGLIAVTSKDYGITWDEPAYFEAADLHIEWLHAFARNLVAGKESRSLDDGAITTAWHGNPYYVPHPPFSRLVSGLSKALLAQWLGDFSAYRIGPALFFAVLVAAMFVWLRELFGTAAGIFSALALLLIPNLFGYAHLAVTDLPLAALWFLTVYCFWKGLFNWKWSVVLGVVWGLALATKFPALLIPIPLILWAHFFHRDKYANNLFALIFVAPVIMVAVQPYLWHQTGLRVLEFLYEGLSRAYRPD